MLGMKRIVGLAVVLAAFGLSACGDDDDSQTTAVTQAPTEQAGANAKAKAPDTKVREASKEKAETEPSSAEEQEVEQNAQAFYEILGADRAKSPERTTIDSTSFCALMSEEAKAQTIHYAEVSSGIQQKWDCEGAVELLAQRSKGSGEFENVKGAEVIGVNAEGGKATATIRFANGVVTSVAMVKEGGEWKLAGSVVGSGGE